MSPTRREFLKGLGALVALAAAPAAVELFPTYASGGTITSAAWGEGFTVGDVVLVTFGTRREDDGYYTITSITPNSFTVESGR